MPLTSSSPRAHSKAAAHLRVDGISVSFGARRVLTDVSLTVAAGDRTALIGENGSGKTTLLRVIAGLIPSDAGAVTVVAPGGRVPSIGLLHQEPPFAPTVSVAAAIGRAVAEARAATAAVDATARALGSAPEDRGAADAYAAALDTAERLGAWDVDARIAAMLAGLGLAGIPTETETRRLSGGQRARLALAWLLLRAPDVLLLDEPTNHLDDAAAEYLCGVLATWSDPVLVASHDRAFLDAAATSLVDLDPSPLPHSVAGPLTGDGEGTGIGAIRFSGAYTDYVHARVDARLRWESQYRDEQAELKRLSAAVRDNHTVGHVDWSPRTEGRAAAKFYADRNAKAVSRRVNDARSRLDDLERRQIRRPPRALSFQGLTAGTNALGQPRSSPGPLVVASEVAVTGRLAPLSLTVSTGEKWLVTGPNGAGKSTLLHLLHGDLAPTSGTVGGPRSARVGLLAQQVDLPDRRDRGPDRTARQAYQDLVGADRAEKVPLATFGLLAGRDENRSVRLLSVGQQRRLALAVVLADPPDVLLLDEPTNHLSLALVTELEAAIPDYPGAVVVASHDRWLRHAWGGRRLELTAV